MKFLRMLPIASGLVLLGTLSAFSAEREGVVVSIKPLHSLVSAVMDGVGQPDLIVKGAGSEHIYSLKPSDAEAIERAKVIFWAGPSMETFLAKSVETLGEGALVVPLGEAEGLTRLKFREGGPFETHSHGPEHDDHDHAHSHADHHNHGAHHQDEHGEYDLHFWLDPQNGIVLVNDIARILSKSDPEHAAQYKENADAYSKRLASLTTSIKRELEPVKGKPFIVFHDAYQYFENRFGLAVAGSITVSPEKAPGAARIRQIRDKVKELDAICVFAEPQFEPRLVQTVVEGTNAKTGTLDPLGADLAAGPELYPQLIRNLANGLKECLKS